jgi:hypothetical protein
MKLKFSRILAVAGALALAALGTAAQARDVYWSVGIHAAPGVAVGVGNVPIYAPQPVYVAQPVYVPQPVYLAPRPVYVAPAPVYYARPAPIYYGPRIHHHRHHGGHRGHHKGH